jgi:hypothetical protein
VGLVVFVTAAVSACSSSPAGSTSTGSASGNSTSAVSAAYPAIDTATVQKMAKLVLNGNVKIDQLAPEIQTAMMVQSVSLTDAQRKVYNDCLANDSCDLGNGGKYTLAIVDDQVNTWYSMTRGEVIAYALKSGEIGKIIHFANNMDVQKYLADWRTAIGQGSDLIVSNFGALGNQAGPVIDQAKAAGIPVANGCCILAPEVAQKLSAQFNVSICDMWANGGAADLVKHLKAKGIENPTYALFTGPAGNAFAAAWQPCAAKAMDAAGMKKAYEGTTDWTPQGTVKAAAALRASGTNPSVLVYDTYAEDFIHAYMDANDKNMPMFVLTASTDAGTVKAYQEADKAGFKPDMWVAPANVWLQGVELSLVLALKDGKKLSSNVIGYPLSFSDMKDVAPQTDLSVDNAAFLGSTLAPKDQNEALKH